MSVRFSFPFLATDWSQFDAGWGDEGCGAEAVIFDRSDLVDSARWALVETNLRRAAPLMGSRLLFHFPVNESNYVEDPLIRDRLWYCLDLAANLGLGGIVLHSNIVRPVRAWSPESANVATLAFLDFAALLARRLEGAPMWVGLENMPIMGNDALDLDPTLVFPADFAGLCSGQLGITWDLCHWSYSVHVVEKILTRELNERDFYPRLREAQYLDFARICDRIVHFHFSGFRGLARVHGGGVKQCHEGVGPWEADVPEAVYEQMLSAMAGATRAQTITFEVAEESYRVRPRTRAVMEWCRRRIAEDPAWASRSHTNVGFR